MSGRKSRNKGKVGEREASKKLGEAIGIPLSRGVQYHGGPSSPDVVGFEGVHIEIKRDESTIGKSLYRALAQADNDCGSNIPMVLSRRNQESWVVAVRLDNLVEFCRRVVQVAGLDNNIISAVRNAALDTHPVHPVYGASPIQGGHNGFAERVE